MANDWTEAQVALSGEVGRLLNDAEATGVPISAYAQASRLAQAYPAARMTSEDIARLIIHVSRYFRVVVELERLPA